MTYKFKVKDYGDNGKIVTISEKEFYSMDNNVQANQWAKTIEKGTPVDAPSLLNALKACEYSYNTYTCNAIGMLHSNAGNVGENTQKVCLFSTSFANPGSFVVTRENLRRVVALFTARKLIEPNWINDKDEYMVPDVNHKDYEMFENDALVFSLFHSASNQSSLRSIPYKDKLWNIENEFFFMGNAEMRKLSNDHNFLSCYNDTIAFPDDREIYKVLQGLELSKDSREILDMACDLIRRSFPLRADIHEIRPEFHLNCWDAGWYQIRNGILKEHFKEDYKRFVNLYKALGNRLRPMVYELGFLNK